VTENVPIRSPPRSPVNPNCETCELPFGYPLHSKTGASAAPIVTVRLVLDAPDPKVAEAVVPFLVAVAAPLQAAFAAQLTWSSTMSNFVLGLDGVSGALVAVNV
jgi:hypothetical protein